MLIVLASYFEPENHGTGRKIGISPGKKPKQEQIDQRCEEKGVEPYSIDDCAAVFRPISPGDYYWDYMRDKKSDYKEAGRIFRESYSKQLDEFAEGVREKADKEGKDVFEILPFKDGDTLLSWEHKGHMSYRTMLADTLRDLGYDVEEN
jgi:hypothetical protein